MPAPENGLGSGGQAQMIHFYWAWASERVQEIQGWAGYDLLDLAVIKSLDNFNASAERLTKSAFGLNSSI